MTLEQLTSSIYANVVSGLPGMTVNGRFTLEQIEDDVIAARQKIIKDYILKNLLPKHDLMLSIRCLPIDCESIERCECRTQKELEKIKHFEIPQIISDFGAEGVAFLGSPDGNIEYKVYTDRSYKNHKFNRRGGNKPYAWIDTTPNANNMYDGFIFNATPLLKNLSISAIFKDPRQLHQYSCCNTEEINNISYIDADIKTKVTEDYIRYYRQMATANTINDQTVKP